MKALLLTRVSAMWALLVGATLLSWELGHGVGFSGASASASVAILVVTFVKLRVVVQEFMEIRHAPRGLRWAFDGWIVLACALLVGLFLRSA